MFCYFCAGKLSYWKYFWMCAIKWACKSKASHIKNMKKCYMCAALSVNFMLQPHKQIRTNILLSSHNLKLKFMLYTDNHRAGSHSTGACLTNPSQLTCYPRQISMLPTLYMYISVCVCVCLCVRCIWGMCGFCLTSSISCSLWQSAGECANCFNWLTTRSQAMESFDRQASIVFVCEFACPPHLFQQHQLLVMPETGTCSPCNALIPVANPS